MRGRKGKGEREKSREERGGKDKREERDGKDKIEEEESGKGERGERQER